MLKDLPLFIVPGVRFAVIEQTVATPNVPGGSSFKTIVRICMTKVSAFQTRLRVSFKILFTQKPMFKGINEYSTFYSTSPLNVVLHTGMIEKGTKDGTKKHYMLLSEAIEELCQQHPEGDQSTLAKAKQRAAPTETEIASPSGLKRTPHIKSPSKPSTQPSTTPYPFLFTSMQPSAAQMVVIYTILFVLVMSYVSLIRRIAELEQIVQALNASQK
jgi:hypothetical protein